MKAHQVDDMKEDAVRRYLKALIEALDTQDQDDYFGTQGWRYFLMGEDN